MEKKIISIYLKEFTPLSNHQIGIKIKKIVIDKTKYSENKVILDFEDVEVCTDSFIQQLTTILVEEITFTKFKNQVRFKNLNDFIQKLVKSKLYIILKSNKKIEPKSLTKHRDCEFSPTDH